MRLALYSKELSTCSRLLKTGFVLPGLFNVVNNIVQYDTKHETQNMSYTIKLSILFRFYYKTINRITDLLFSIGTFEYEIKI